MISLMLAVVLAQAVDPNDKQAVAEFACVGGVIESMEALGKKDDTAREAVLRLRCKGGVAELARNGALAKERDVIAYGCGLGLGAAFHMYDLDHEIRPTLSARALTIVKKCAETIGAIQTPKPPKKKK